MTTGENENFLASSFFSKQIHAKATSHKLHASRLDKISRQEFLVNLAA